MLNKITKIKTTTINYRKDWRIDIVENTEKNPTLIELWLYKKNYGIKKLMFGLPKNNLVLEELEDIIDNNINEYIESYEENNDIYD